ncbi:transglutaminase domain-containing protein [Litorimonas sp. RW-G-Af-16]|uniref:transglutaminase family protein n=1 Tax=Litorimonas sp. RW-G-Af-16 TaxID=3241168 RepID=UPI00390CB474
MILDISHKTEYRFDEAPQYGLQQIRLTPKSQTGQAIKVWDIHFEGGQCEAIFTDYNDNLTHLISLDAGSTHLTVTSAGQVDMTDQHGIVGPHRGYAPLWLYLRDTMLTEPGKGIAALAQRLAEHDGTELEKLHALSAAIGQNVRYETGTTDSMTTAEDAIKAGVGVCQDHSHIFIAAARQSGFPARYVSGYLMMNDRIAQDATHAWAEVHIQDLGWVGFDVSNQISPDARYVRVATGLDYSDAAPISGLTFGGQNESISVDVQVQQ